MNNVITITAPCNLNSSYLGHIYRINFINFPIKIHTYLRKVEIILPLDNDTV